eukprot:gene7347-8559_t
MVCKALARLCAWKARGKVPLAIEATASLVQIFQSKGIVSENERELALGMAINRLVNGVTESLAGGKSKSMFSRAAAVSLPSHFVDIRHEAAHGRLPSIHVLTMVGRSALQWLDDNYWSAQQGVIVRARTACRNILTNLRESDITSKSIKTQTKQSAQTLVSLIAGNLLESVLIPLIIDEGYLLSRTNETAAVVNSLTPSQKMLWEPLFRHLNTRFPHFLVTMMYLLTDRLTNSATPEDKRRQLATWILHLMHTQITQTTSDLHLDIPYRFMFERCVVDPSPAASRILASVRQKLTKKDMASLNSVPPPYTTFSTSSSTNKYRLINTWQPCPIGVLSSTSLSSSSLDLPATASSTIYQVEDYLSLTDTTYDESHWLAHISTLLVPANNNTTTNHINKRSATISADTNNNSSTPSSPISNITKRLKTDTPTTTVQDIEGLTSNNTKKKLKSTKKVSKKVNDLLFWK